MQFPNWLTVVGDKGYRNKKAPPEQAEQITFVNWLRTKYPMTYGRIVFHVKNEGKRTARQAQIDRLEGLTRGAPDIVIPCNPPILIELKRQDHTLSRFQDGQLEYLEAAQKMGARVCVALGHKAAIQFFEECIK